MSFIPTINAIKVSIIGSLFGQQIVLDLTVGTPSAVTTGDLEDTADAISDWLSDELMTGLVSQYVQNEIKCYDMLSDTAPVFSLPVSIPGELSAGTFGNNVALVTSFLTANRGKSGRGRAYVAGVESDVGDGTGTTSGVASGQNGRFANLSDFLGPLGFTHVVVSKRHNNADRVAGLKQPVIAYRTNVDWDSQRRRLKGRGA